MVTTSACLRFHPYRPSGFTHHFRFRLQRYSFFQIYAIIFIAHNVYFQHFTKCSDASLRKPTEHPEVNHIYIRKKR